MGDFFCPFARPSGGQNGRARVGAKVLRKFSTISVTHTFGIVRFAGFRGVEVYTPAKLVLDIDTAMWYNVYWTYRLGRRILGVVGMLGPGRRPGKPEIGEVRQLTLEEVLSPRGRVAPIQRFRDSHHRMARLFASGLRVKEVAELTGYSISRVSLFHSSPAFQELIAQKREVEDEVLKDEISIYNQLILQNGLKAERKLADKLDDDDENEEMSVRELISIARDAADRVGLSKRTVQTNFDINFADLLDKAIKRSEMPRSGDLKLVESSSAPAAHPTPDRGPTSSPSPSPVLRRRV